MGGASPAGGMPGRGRDSRPNHNVQHQWHLLFHLVLLAHRVLRAYRSRSLFGNISAEVGRMAPSLSGQAGSMDPHHSQASNLSSVLVERGCLSEREVELLMEAARQHRWGHRDATAILVAYQHGLRASELVALRWNDIDLTTGRLRIRRSKGGGAASSHPISAQESLALR